MLPQSHSPRLAPMGNMKTIIREADRMCFFEFCCFSGGNCTGSWCLRVDSAQRLISYFYLHRSFSRPFLEILLVAVSNLIPSCCVFEVSNPFGDLN